MMDGRQDDPAAAQALAGDLRALIGKLKRRLRDETHPGDLTWSQMSVLGRLERDGPATVTTLARAEGVRPQSMGATVSVLETSGFISGTPDPSDGRQTVLSLTPSCVEMIKAARAAREDWLFRAIRASLTPTEQQQLATGVDLLKRVADY